MRSIILVATSFVIASIAGLGTHSLSLLASRASEEVSLLERCAMPCSLFGFGYVAIAIGGMYALYQRSAAGMLFASVVGGGLYLFEALLN